MKLSTHFRFNMPFETWVTTMEDGLYTYIKRGDGVGTLLSGTAGSVVLITPEALVIGDGIRHLRDLNGNEVFMSGGVGYAMFVNDCTPQLDPMGRIVAWRSTLKRTIPRDIEQALLDSLG